MILRTYRYRLYPTKEQASKLRFYMGCNRWAYNWALELKIKHYQKQKSEGVEKPEVLEPYYFSKLITTLKKEEEFKWLSKAPSAIFTYTFRHLDFAYKKFFKNLKKGGPPGFPKFKKRTGGGSIHFILQKHHIKQEEGLIRIPKIKNTVINIHRPLPQGDNISIKRCTLKMYPSGKFYISIMIEDQSRDEVIPVLTPKSELKVLGIDQGIKKYITCSDGKTYPTLPVLEQYEKRLKRENRKLNRKVKGSRNREKQKIRLATIYEKIKLRRTGYINFVARDLVKYAVQNGYNAISFRQFSIKEMIANNKTNKKGVEQKNQFTLFEQKEFKNKIINASWFKLQQAVKDFTTKEGMHFIIVPSKDTTRKCHHCGHTSEQNLKINIFVCQACGIEKDIDLNSALNTADLGYNLYKPLQSER